MSDWNELKKLAEHHRSLGHAYTVATPAAVLALIAENERLRKSLEAHRRMLVGAAEDIGTIGEALGAEMDDDASEMAGMAVALRKDAERYRWLQGKDGADWEYYGYQAGVMRDKEIDAAMAKEAGQ